MSCEMDGIHSMNTCDTKLAQTLNVSSVDHFLLRSQLLSYIIAITFIQRN